MPSVPTLTADQIRDLVGGDLLGDPTAQITGVAPLARAGPTDASFLAHRRYLSDFGTTKAVLVVVSPIHRAVPGPANRVVVDDPHRAIAAITAALCPLPAPAWGIGPGVRLDTHVSWSGRIGLAAGVTVGAGTTFGADCLVGPGATVGTGVRIGNRCRLGAAVHVESGVRMGDDVVVQPGARIGTEGFGFVPGPDVHTAVRHVGGCVLEDGVYVGANTCVDRGSIGDTIVGSETKIDNLVQVGHNSRIGRRCFIMAQVGLAGSTVVEDDVILAGQAGLAGHLTVGAGARVAAQGGVIGDVPAGATVSGYPARSHRDVLRQAAALRRLAPMAARLEALVRDRDDR